MHYSWPRVPSAVYNEKSWTSSQSRAAVFSWRPSFAYRSVPRDRRRRRQKKKSALAVTSIPVCALVFALQRKSPATRRDVKSVLPPPPPRSRRNEARTTSCEAFDLVWLRGMAECAKLFSTAERREKKKMKRGGEKTEKGSVFGIYWRRSMASRPSGENILMLHRCLYGNSIGFISNRICKRNTNFPLHHLVKLVLSPTTARRVGYLMGFEYEQQYVLQ